MSADTTYQKTVDDVKTSMWNSVCKLGHKQPQSAQELEQCSKNARTRGGAVYDGIIEGCGEFCQSSRNIESCTKACVDIYLQSAAEGVVLQLSKVDGDVVNPSS